MRLFQLLLVTVVLFTLLLPLDARAADGPGTSTVRRANATLNELLKRKAAPKSAEERRLATEVTAKLRSFLDVEELGRRALAKHWDGLTPEQRSEFTTLLREIVEASYLKALRSELEYEVHYLEEKPADSNVVVKTELRVDNGKRRQTIGVDYVLRRDGDGWRVFDLVTDGVGMVENYRAQFNQVIGKEGFSGLLTRMRKKAQPAP